MEMDADFTDFSIFNASELVLRSCFKGIINVTASKVKKMNSSCLFCWSDRSLVLKSVSLPVLEGDWGERILVQSSNISEIHTHDCGTEELVSFVINDSKVGTMSLLKIGALEISNTKIASIETDGIKVKARRYKHRSRIEDCDIERIQRHGIRLEEWATLEVKNTAVGTLGTILLSAGSSLSLENVAIGRIEGVGFLVAAGAQLTFTNVTLNGDPIEMTRDVVKHYVFDGAIDVNIQNCSNATSECSLGMKVSILMLG